MTSIDFDKLSEEVIAILEKEPSVVIATSQDNKVTARTMSHVNDGLAIYFQTSDSSEKFTQIKANPQIAIAVSNMQIEARAEICGRPGACPEFIRLFKAKYPRYYEMYTNREDEVLIKAEPAKIKLWKYVSGAPCCEIADVFGKMAYRENQ